MCKCAEAPQQKRFNEFYLECFVSLFSVCRKQYSIYLCSLSWVHTKRPTVLSRSLCHTHTWTVFSLSSMFCIHTLHAIWTVSLSLLSELNAVVQRIRYCHPVLMHTRIHHFTLLSQFEHGFCVYELLYRYEFCMYALLKCSIVQHCTTMNVSRSNFIVSMCMVFFLVFLIKTLEYTS